MLRHQTVLWFLLAGASQTGDCRFASGPDGFCAFIRLDPTESDLRVGSTLQVNVNGLTCDRGTACVDCADRRHRVRWVSSAPEIAGVDSTGLVRGVQVGRADIRLESDDGIGGTMRVVVFP